MQGVIPVACNLSQPVVQLQARHSRQHGADRNDKPNNRASLGPIGVPAVVSAVLASVPCDNISK